MITEIYVAQKLALAGFAIFVFLIILQMVSRKMQIRITPKERRQIYACGEDLDPEYLNIPHGSFYKTIIRMLGFVRMTRSHTGDLSTYLAWILIGVVAIIGVLMILW
jgi:hypothetical protein